MALLDNDVTACAERIVDALLTYLAEEHVPLEDVPARQVEALVALVEYELCVSGRA